MPSAEGALGVGPTAPLPPSRDAHVSRDGMVTPSRRSARHGIGADGAAVTDEDSMAKAMCRKATVNLDSQGMHSSSKSFLPFSTPLISARLSNVGVSLGSSLDAIYLF
jgi:hypothetical protein